MTFLKIINANLIYTMSFLILLVNVGRDPHYIATFALISGITIVLAFKMSLKKYNELNILIGGVLIYGAFLLNTIFQNLPPFWLILGLSVGASLVLQTIFYKYPKLFPMNVATFIIFALFAVTGAEFLSSRYYLEVTLEIGILLSFLGLILNEPRSWSRFIISITLQVLHPVKIKGVNNIKEKGPFVFVANHPSFYDHLIIEQSLPCEAAFYSKNLNDTFSSQRAKDFTLFHNQPNNIDNQYSGEPLEQAKKALLNQQSIVIMPELQVTGKETPMNEWSDDLNKLIETMGGINIVPISIKDIHTHYSTQYDENGNVLAMKPAKYFHPIELEFGEPIFIDSEQDTDKIKKLIEKMGKNRL